MIANDFMADIQTALEEGFASAMTDTSRERVRAALEDWLLTRARKKPLPDLEQRLDDFRKRIGRLARHVKLGYFDGKLVVNATGDGEITLRMLERGTDWFDPADNLTELIAGAILGQP